MPLDATFRFKNSSRTFSAAFLFTRKRIRGAKESQSSPPPTSQGKIDSRIHGDVFFSFHDSRTTTFSLIKFTNCFCFKDSVNLGDIFHIFIYHLVQICSINWQCNVFRMFWHVATFNISVQYSNLLRKVRYTYFAAHWGVM